MGRLLNRGTMEKGTGGLPTTQNNKEKMEGDSKWENLKGD